MTDDKKLKDENLEKVTGGDGAIYNFTPEDLSEPVSIIRDEIENVTPKFSMDAGADKVTMPAQDTAESRHPRK